MLVEHSEEESMTKAATETYVKGLPPAGSVISAELTGNVIIGVVTDAGMVRILAATFPGDCRRIGDEAQIMPLFWKIRVLADTETAGLQLAAMHGAITRSIADDTARALARTGEK
jgi:hypothetical protein